MPSNWAFIVTTAPSIATMLKTIPNIVMDSSEAVMIDSKTERVKHMNKGLHRSQSRIYWYLL